MTEAVRFKQRKKGLVMPLTAFLRGAEVLHMAKEPQIIGRMFGNMAGRCPCLFQMLSKKGFCLFSFPSIVAVAANVSLLLLLLLTVGGL